MLESQYINSYYPQITAFPLILAGPILRQTEANSVTVWLAVKESRSLALEIYATRNRGREIGELLFQGQRKTIKLGKHLHIVAITARTERSLQAETIYAYNIRCLETGCDLIADRQQSGNSLSYFDHYLPTFTLPATEIEHLKIVHGSCRKPHGGGRDTLSCLDNLIREEASSAINRPQQLFLTGDQIYGDDVANPMLWLAQQVNRLLFGWVEELPLLETTIFADELPPGKRSEIARLEGGFTAMLRGKSEKAKSHLFSFGEYAAIYLLAWSPIFIPHRFPDGQNFASQSTKKWNQELKDTRSFFRDLGAVRRALANIPVYTICDDHDVSDDFYLNRHWCDRVLSKPLGKRVVQNGMLAYALFQAWGNTPQHFAPNTPGERLLQLAEQWLASAGKDSKIKQKCDRFLGIPDNDPQTGLPRFKTDREFLILDRDSQAIPWHYQIQNSKHEVIVLDTRTWRGYPPGKDKGLEPPMLLCPEAFNTQLQQPLKKSPETIEVTMVVLPTNLVALRIIDRVQQIELSRNRVFSSDVGDSWNFHQEAFATLLLSLCRHRDRVIILSGDIHYSCAVRLTYWETQKLQPSIIVQLTSSAIKNSELATRLVHTRIKALFPEKSERWLGWNQPLKVKKSSRFSVKSDRKNLPDWQYSTKWYKRQPARSLSWKRLIFQSATKSPWWQKIARKITNFIWRNRWLQEGSEVVGRNNLSVVKFQWSKIQTVVQETYWHPPWDNEGTVKSRYEIPFESKPLTTFAEKKDE